MSKILKFRAENVKRLKVVEIEPDGNTVIISGKNEQGKTSVLDAIWYALGGTKNIPERPVRDGEDHAAITLDLGDYVVTRTWNGNDKTYLKVSNKDGATFSSPQSLLNKMVGDLSFDPLQFARKDGKTQRDILIQLAGIGEMINEWDAERAEYYDDRRVVNREIKSLQGQLDGMDEPDDDLPEEPVHLGELMDAMSTLQDGVDKHESLKLSMEHHAGKVSSIDEQIADYEQRIRDLKAKRDEHVAAINETKSEIDSADWPTRDDVKAIRTQMEQQSEINDRIRAAKAYRDTQDQLKRKEEESANLSQQIEDIDAKKAGAVAEADLPVEGLSFTDNGVIYGGIPFDQCSAAEQLKVSLAIAMSLNPELRVIRITDGSLLDAENLELIRDMANENDYQVWIERVDDGGTGVVIEDGMIKGD